MIVSAYKGHPKLYKDHFSNGLRLVATNVANYKDRHCFGQQFWACCMHHFESNKLYSCIEDLKSQDAHDTWTNLPKILKRGHINVDL